MRNSYLRKEDLVYQPKVAINDGLESSLQALSGENRLTLQAAKMFKDIQDSEIKLRDAINEQQNKVILLDASNKLSDINRASIVEHKYNPEAFKQQTNELSTKVLNTLPLHLREAARQDFLRQQSQYYFQALDNQRRYLDKQAFEQAQLSIQGLAKDATACIPGLLTTDNDLIKTSAQVGLGLSVAQANQFLEAKDSYGLDLFSPLQKEEIKQKFYGVIFEQFASAQMEAMPNMESKLEFLKDIATGNAKITYRDESVENIFEVPFNILNEKKRKQLVNELAKQLKEQNKIQQEEAKRQIAYKALSGQTDPMPHDKDYRESMDAYYKSEIYDKFDLGNIGSAPPEVVAQATESIVRFVVEGRVYPDSLEDNIRSFISSGNPVLFKMGSDIIGRVDSQNKDITKQLNLKNLNAALKMYELVQGGTPFDQAYMTIDNNYFKVSKEEYENRLKIFETEIKKSIDKDWGKPTSSSEIAKKSEFVNLAREFYIQGGDWQVAKKTAEIYQSKRWAKSTINGGSQEMALAPELYYENDVLMPASRMRVLAEKNVKPFVNDTSRIVIKPDEITYTQIGGKTPKPSYGVYYREDNGLLNRVYDDANQPVRVGVETWGISEENPEFKTLLEDKLLLEQLREQERVINFQTNELKRGMINEELEGVSKRVAKAMARNKLKNQREEVEKKRKEVVKRNREKQFKERYGDKAELLTRDWKQIINEIDEDY